MQQSLWRSKHYILSRGNRKKRKIEIDISWSSTLLSFYWVFDNMISRKKKRKFFRLALSVADERLLILDAENFEKLFSDSVKVLPMNNTIDCSYSFFMSLFGYANDFLNSSFFLSMVLDFLYFFLTLSLIRMIY